jgi:hypothetical protein
MTVLAGVVDIEVVVGVLYDGDPQTSGAQQW